MSRAEDFAQFGWRTLAKKGVPGQCSATDFILEGDGSMRDFRMKGKCEDSAQRSEIGKAEHPVSEPLVEILMSTHNGAKYLSAQIESLFAQTHKNWRLIVRDDKSSDNTIDIIEEYCGKYPDKIKLVADGEGQLGACQSFARVLQHADANYMMFCDQDDVWLPHKVETSVKELLRHENEGPPVPMLLFTDLIVVDETLSVLADSFWRYQKVHPCNTWTSSLLFDNVATGCTIIFNKLLKDVAQPIPPEALMHDWWLALVCSIHGRLGYLRDRTLLYRQHGKNDLGAQDYSLAFRVRRFVKSPQASVSRTTRMVNLMRRQAQVLLEHAQHQEVSDPRVLLPLQQYLQSHTLLQRKWCLVRHSMLSGNYIKGVRKLLFC